MVVLIPIAELSDGSLHYNTRRHWAPSKDDALWRWFATRTAGGKTWQNPQRSKIFPDGDPASSPTSRTRDQIQQFSPLECAGTLNFTRVAYEVLSGNTTDKTTLADFLKKIETQYGKADRIWIMDRGIPTEETLLQMRQSDPPVCYLVGTPKGRLTTRKRPLKRDELHLALGAEKKEPVAMPATSKFKSPSMVKAKANRHPHLSARSSHPASHAQSPAQTQPHWPLQSAKSG